jgi:hypothetical protein
MKRIVVDAMTLVNAPGGDEIFPRRADQGWGLVDVSEPVPFLRLLEPSGGKATGGVSG